MSGRLPLKSKAKQKNQNQNQNKTETGKRKENMEKLTFKCDVYYPDEYSVGLLSRARGPACRTTGCMGFL